MGCEKTQSTFFTAIVLYITMLLGAYNISCRCSRFLYYSKILRISPRLNQSTTYTDI